MCLDKIGRKLPENELKGHYKEHCQLLREQDFIMDLPKLFLLFNMVFVPLFFMYPIIGLVQYNQFLAEINKDEHDEHGVMIKGQIEFLWK